MIDTINFDDNLAVIDHNTLKKTADYEMARGGLPKSRPIEHHQLITDIVDGIESKTTKKAKVGEVYATERQSMMVGWKASMGACPVDKFLLQRIVTKININDTDTKNGLNSAVAISYTEKGIQLAFGTNVHACSNTMIWGDNFMSTWGSNRTEYQAMIDAFDSWMMNFDDKRLRNMEIIQQLKNRLVKESEMFEFLGHLIYEAERANTSKEIAPLNVSQTLRLIDHYEVVKDGNPVTAWDITNFGTNDLKADRHAKDLTQIYDTTHKFSNRIAEHFLDINLN